MQLRRSLPMTCSELGASTTRRSELGALPNIRSLVGTLPQCDSCLSMPCPAQEPLSRCNGQELNHILQKIHGSGAYHAAPALSGRTRYVQDGRLQFTSSQVGASPTERSEVGAPTTTDELTFDYRIADSFRQTQVGQWAALDSRVVGAFQQEQESWCIRQRHAGKLEHRQ